MNKVILCLMVTVVIIFTSCSKNENAKSYAEGGALPTNYVSILDNGFSPASITVSNGSSVTFLNSTNNTHTLVSDDLTTFVSPQIPPAKYFLFKKYLVGVINYHCVEHPTERGSITQIP